ncbi:MAG TPA: RHS repeat-associated core domain-containing protein [Vicinamibacterales bacterium]|nr:RHS repeat-associated core domain-containing protein [Vicinamibacterales bacterium]
MRDAKSFDKRRIHPEVDPVSITQTNLVTNEYTTAADAPTPAGWVKKQTHADGGVYEFAYLVSNGRSTRTDVTDPLDHVRRVTFNSAGYRLNDTRAFGLAEAQTTTSDRSGNGNFITTSVDTVNGQLTKTVYVRNEFGNVTSVTRCLAGQDPCTDTSPGSLTTRYTYDPRFQDIATVTDPLNHTTTYGYDDAGDLRSVTDALQHSTTLEYNGQGQITATTDALQHTTRFDYVGGDLVATTDPLMRVTRRFIDAGGRLLSVTDPMGQTTRYTYDRNNQVLSITDALGGQTGFAYFPDGQLQSVTDAEQHATSYTYDVMGRMASRTDPLLRAETFSYDLRGNPHVWIDRKGQITTRSYDHLDRLEQIEYGDASTITYTYDDRGRIRQLDDSASNASIVRTFDDFDRLLSETTAQGSVGYSYDAASRRTKLTRTGQPDIVYAYDNADRLTGVTRDTATVIMTHDNADRRATVTLPNGIVTEYGYDDSNQITLITYRYGATTLGDLTYAYDSAGRRTILGGTWARTGLPAAVSAATYDAANQLTAWGTDTRQYDANGSLASDGLTSYVWDARQRLSGTSGASAKTFAYDAMGRRVSATINGSSATYQYDGANHVSRTVNSQSVQFMSGGALDEWFARIDSSGTKVFLRDALGSTVAVADAAGAITDAYTYDPFGRTVAQGSTGSAERFTGREQDDDDLYYYRARYYRSSEGRFLGEDAIRMAPQTSLYGYADNDPVSFTDPTGRLKGPPPRVGVPGLGLGAAALITFDIWIIQHDIDLLRQLCEAYGYCNPTPSNSRECAAKQWTCTVRCAVIDLRTGSAVRYIETEGVGSSPEEAFKDGQKRLQNSTPQGFRTKHCHTVGRCTQK